MLDTCSVDIELAVTKTQTGSFLDPGATLTLNLNQIFFL